MPAPVGDVAIFAHARDESFFQFQWSLNAKTKSRIRFITNSRGSIRARNGITMFLYGKTHVAVDPRDPRPEATGGIYGGEGRVYVYKVTRIDTMN